MIVPCGTPFLNWCCVDVLFLNVVCGMFVWCGLCVSVCMVSVLNVLFMSSVTVIVWSGGLFWLKSVVMVLFMFCRVVAFEAMLRGDVWDVVCDVWE